MGLRYLIYPTHLPEEMEKSEEDVWLAPPWGARPASLTIPASEVHIWRVSLDSAASQVEQLSLLLSAAERERAERFHFDRDRRRMIVAHAALRDILSRYGCGTAAALRFGLGLHAKPYLMDECGGEAIRFNLTHSGELALVAIAFRREVGVDVEQIRDLDYLQLAAHSFAPSEAAALSALPTAWQATGFFNCWTRKEAYIKARGDGLALPLDQFAVSLAPGQPAALLYSQAGEQEQRRWSLQALQPQPGYVGAIAVEGHGCQLKLWQWNWSFE
jgi:4'-phosphopantetheinyl transferase